jgi:fatty acid desaturase
VLESLAGVHTLRILLGRRRSFRTGTGGEEAPGGGYYTAMLPLGIAANGTVVLGAALADHPWFAAAWAAGALAVLPFLAAVRQILEHRSVAADPRADYRRVDHGVVNRMFGSGPIASTLGGAGFNRHLLHHWDPQVPCTRLAELERYLRGTAFAEVIRSAETTYLRTLRELFRRA